MYMIGALGMLCIYQIRHVDIHPNAEVPYIVMAMVILLSVVGTIYTGLVLWVVFSILLIIVMFAVSAEFYYKSQWKIGIKFIFGSTLGLGRG